MVAIKQGERYDRLKTRERHRDNALFVGFAPAGSRAPWCARSWMPGCSISKAT
ncbi:Penicillin-binding protein 2 (PBP-2) [Pseudomonas chlororaphis]|nr:Penicillin-binding protein 2 (PBP-2) [Pseudomonas chlororaphis]